MLEALAALPEVLGETKTLFMATQYFSGTNVNACVMAEIEPLIAQGRQGPAPPLAERTAANPPAP